MLQIFEAIGYILRVVALSVDDTKLLASLQPFLEHESGKWFLIGSTGEPIEIPDPENFEELLDKAHASKATKVNPFASYHLTR